MKLNPQQREKLKNKVWSYSALSLFKRCPASFYDVYVEGRRAELPKTFFGKAFHTYAEEYLKGNKNPNIDLILEQNKVPKRDYPDFLLCIDNFKPFRNRVIGRNRFRQEESLFFEYEGCKFVVKMDLVLFSHNSVSIADYKTSKVTDYCVEYKDQMKLYDYGVEKVTGIKPIRRFLFYPRIGSEIFIEMEGHDSNTMKDNLSTIRIALDSDFEPKVNRFCDECPLFKEKRCSAYKGF